MVNYDSDIYKAIDDDNTTLFNYDRPIHKTNKWWNTTLFNYDRAIYKTIVAEITEFV